MRNRADITRRTFLGTAALTAVSPALDALAQGRGGRGGGAAAAPVPIPEGVTVEKDVAYGKGGTLDLKLDIYKPNPGTEKRAATILLLGGGFTGASKDTLN